MSEWRECKLGDVVTLKRGFDLPTQNRVNGVYPVYSSSGLTGYHSRYMVEGEGVITGRYGTIGQVFFANGSHWPLNTTLFVEDFHGNDKKYIYWFLQTINWDGLLTASAVPGVNRNHAHMLPVTVPPIPTQRAIAEVLSSLDDKIDLLTRQNATLEALAQTYFRQWFVEDASEGFARLGDYFPVKTGKKDANFSSDYGLYPFFTCSQTPLKADSYSYDESSVLLAGNGDFNVKWYRGKFEAYQRTYILTPYDASNLSWLYFAIKFYLGDITAGHRGSVINFITKGMIEDFNFPLAKRETFVKFKSFSTAVITKLEGNNAQVQTLKKLRDTLLPKLINGEIRVKVAL